MAVLAGRLGVLFFFGVLLCSSSAVYAATVEYCEKGANYQVKVSAVDISPYPIVRGKPSKFTISASTDHEISKGKAIIDVKYFGFHIHQETHDFCEETACPILAGDFVMSHQQTLPSFTPPGSYTLTMRMMGEDGKKLTCFTFDFRIGFLYTS